MAGLLALVGGAEFTPGNEPHDELMVRRAPERPAYVVSTAAGGHGRVPAVANALEWFGALGRDLDELPILTRHDASDAEHTRLAGSAGFFYLLGGDPDPVAEVLRESPVWEAMIQSWLAGAVLAGSSAGAMAMCEWVLLKDQWPDQTHRRYSSGLGLIPDCAVLPHFDTFGRLWLASAADTMPTPDTTLLGLDERTAALWDGERWVVAGPGAVTVVKVGRPQQIFRQGDTVVGLEPPSRSS